MKLQLTTDIGKLRMRAEELIDQHFNMLAHQNAHKDAAHASKRLLAKEYLRGEAPNAALMEEAMLEGMKVVEFARQISTKPDLVAVRELERRRVKKIAREGTIEQVRELIKQYEVTNV